MELFQDLSISLSQMWDIDSGQSVTRWTEGIFTGWKFKLGVSPKLLLSSILSQLTTVWSLFSTDQSPSVSGCRLPVIDLGSTAASLA